MFLAGAVPAVVYGWMAFTLPESPRFLVFQGKDGGGPQGLPAMPRRGHGPPPARTSRRPSRRDKVAGQKGSPARQGVRPAASGVDRHHPVGAAAVRRHQRDLLLLHHPVEGRRVPGEGLPDDLRGHVRHEHPRDPGGDRPGGPDRTPAHHAGGLHRHGRLAGHDGPGLRVRHRHRRRDFAARARGARSPWWLPTSSSSASAPRGARWSGCCWARSSRPDPRPRPGPRRGRPVDRQLRHHAELPGHGGGLPPPRPTPCTRRSRRRRSSS